MAMKQKKTFGVKGNPPPEWPGFHQEIYSEFQYIAAQLSREKVIISQSYKSP